MGDPLVSSGFVCYGKKRTTITVQFPGPNGTIWRFEVLKNLYNYFGQFVWIEKRVTIIVAFHFMKRRLKK